MRVQAMWVLALKVRLRTALLQAALLTLIGVVCGVAVNTCRHDGLAWIGARPSADTASGREKAVRHIRIDEAWRRYQEGQILFVDARDPSEYRPAHLPGAVNVPAEGMGKSLDQLKRVTGSGKELVIYCSGPDCPLSSELASALADKGILDVMILSEGWSGWLDAGFPIEESGGK